TKLEQNNFSGQITGEHGTGKTTLLDEIKKHLSDKLECRLFCATLRDKQRNFSQDFWCSLSTIESCENPTVIIVDGYEQLGYFSRLRLRREIKRLNRLGIKTGLLITSHKPIYGIPVIFNTAPDYELFVKIVRHVLNDNFPLFDEIQRKLLFDVFKSTGGNVRFALFELYDYFENMSQT
ncbi:MAG: hypothetical protein ACRC2T_03875, partial [Thermoguttaceae bacterium]